MATEVPTKPNYRQVCFSRAARELGFSRFMFERLVNLPDFPKPRRLGVKLYWALAEIVAWIEAQPRKGGDDAASS
jgi:predicted DNA-binding transcriptional regulator AlpA